MGALYSWQRESQTVSFRGKPGSTGVYCCIGFFAPALSQNICEQLRRSILLSVRKFEIRPRLIPGTKKH